jgi:hypothetical protein
MMTTKTSPNSVVSSRGVTFECLAAVNLTPRGLSNHRSIYIDIPYSLSSLYPYPFISVYSVLLRSVVLCTVRASLLSYPYLQRSKSPPSTSLSSQSSGLYSLQKRKQNCWTLPKSRDPITGYRGLDLQSPGKILPFCWGGYDTMILTMISIRGY